MRIAVLGDVLIDETIDHTVERICPEGPIPVHVRSGRYEENVSLGGAGNVACYLAALMPSHSVHLVSPHRICEDTLGRMILPRNLRIEKAAWAPDMYAETKRRHYVGERMVFRDDDPKDWSFSEHEAQTVATSLRDLRPDVLVVSSYRKALFADHYEADDVIRDVIEELAVPTYADVKEASVVFEPVDWFKLQKWNDAEAERADVGFGIHDQHEPSALVEIITHSEYGATVLEGEKPFRQYPAPEPLHVVDVTGAGDVFLAAYVWQHLTTGDVHRSIVTALDCATDSVTHRGTAWGRAEFQWLNGDVPGLRNGPTAWGLEVAA